MCKPGVRTVEIDRAVEALYAKYGALPLFKGYPGPTPKTPFPAATCISVNEQVVHGIPGQREIREGDLVKLDTACKLSGWCADAAITVMVGAVRPERRRLVETAEHVLKIAYEELGKRRWWSEVAGAMQRHAEAAGYHMVEQYVGHGIGRIMHENPQVPNYVSRDMRKHDFRLEPGPGARRRADGQHGQGRHARARRSVDRRHPRRPAQRPRRAHIRAHSGGRADRHRGGQERHRCNITSFPRSAWGTHVRTLCVPSSE